MRQAAVPMAAVSGEYCVEATSTRLEDMMKHTGRFYRRTPGWCWAAALMAAFVVLPGRGWVIDQAEAEPFDLLFTIPNPTPAVNDQFGRILVAVGNNVLAGAHMDDRGDEDAGVVYLFDGSTGQMLQTFSNPTPGAADWFGKHLAAVGNNVLIGATGDNTGAQYAGAAYLFDGSTGQLLRTFLNPTPEAGERFGSVAPFGDNVLVGAGFDRYGGLQEVGEAYLFDATTRELLWTFKNPTPEEGDTFGGKVASVGSDVLISANRDNTAGQGTGAAYLFELNSLTEQWELKHTFLDPTPHEADRFGTRIAAMGDKVLVAEFSLSNPASTGAVHLFDGLTGGLLRTFLHPDPAPGDLFGSSIAVAGNNILIGARGDDTGATDAGAAFLFDGTTGKLLHTFLNPEPNVDDAFGSAVCVAGGKFVIGVSYDDTSGIVAETIYVFEGPAPIPEPSTITLLLGGGLCLLIHARRLRRRRR